ncbi:histone-lysine N-methyltransferase Smyd1-like [Aplochiton taeniatus]
MFMPESLPVLSPDTLRSWRGLSYPQLVTEVGSLFIPSELIPRPDLEGRSSILYVQGSGHKSWTELGGGSSDPGRRFPLQSPQPQKEVVHLCRESLEKMEPVLADTHLYLLRILSIASEVLSFLQHFGEAAEFARRMVEGYTKLYHHNNAQLGMATMRAGVTHWHAGSIEEGHGMICKAYAILMITHGPNHPITKDLEAMRVQTELELRMFKQDQYAYHTLREAALKDKPMSMAGEPSADEEIKALSRKQ